MSNRWRLTMTRLSGEEQDDTIELTLPQSPAQSDVIEAEAVDVDDTPELAEPVETLDVVAAEESASSDAGTTAMT